VALLDKIFSNFAYSTILASGLGLLVFLAFIAFAPKARFGRGFGSSLIISFFVGQLILSIVGQIHYLVKYENGGFVEGGAATSEVPEWVSSILVSVVFDPAGIIIVIGLLVLLLQTITRFYLLRPIVSIAICLLSIVYGIYYGVTETPNSGM
jgi:hypothetical protein